MPPCLYVGVGQNEEPLPDMRPADFSRRLHARCNPVAHALKVADDVLQAKGEMAGDVFKEAPFRLHFADNAGDVGPEVPGVLVALAVSAEGKGLAGITGREEMNAAAPRFAVEGFDIVPDRSRSQGRVRHPRHESGRGETVPLDITHSSVSGFSEVKAKVKSSDTGAKADAEKAVRSVGGTKSHTVGPFHRAHWIDPGALVKGSAASGNYVPCILGT